MFARVFFFFFFFLPDLYIKSLSVAVGWKLLKSYCWSFLWAKHWYFEIKKTTGSQDFLPVPLVLFHCEQLTRNISQAPLPVKEHESQ